MKIKFIFSFLVFVCCAGNVFSQASGWIWARTAKSDGGNYTNRNCTDPSGNVYVSGYFSSDTICFGTDTLFHTNSYGHDIFLVKYDAAGNVLWAKNFASGISGGNYDDDHDIAADANGNVYFTATLFLDSAAYGNFMLINDSATVNWGLADVVTVKCDPSGNVIWAKDMGGKKHESPEGICVDKNNNVYVIGKYNSDSIFFGNDMLASSGNYNNVFIIKYDSFGNETWAREAAGNGEDYGSGVAVDTLGNIYVTGYFDSDILHFGNILVFNSALGKFDFFIAKYDANGNSIWGKRAAGGNDDWAKDVTVDHAGNILATGYFRSTTLMFDNITLTNTVIGMIDVFVVKYDPLGNTIWAKKGGGIDADLGCGICTDANDAVYVTGTFGLPKAVFGNDTVWNNGTNSTGDIYVVKYDGGGNELWVRSAAGNGDDRGNSVCTDSNGDIYVSGWYWINVSFGNITLNNSGSGGSEIFLAKLDATTGMQELFSNGNSSIFPNPSNGNFTIENNFSPNYEIEIFNSIGQEIFRKEKINQNSFEVDLNEQPNGIYFVRIISNGKNYSQKIIVEK